MPNIGTRLVPSLLVKDLTETLQFYERVLGFRVTGRYSDDRCPPWAEVNRDGIALQFYVDPPHGTPTSPVMSGTLYFYPDSVTALADEFSGRVQFEWGPEVMDYGMREFAVRDPNGYYLAFTEPA